MSDNDDIAAARQRVAMGTANDLDHWRVQRAEQREQMVTKEMPLDGNLLVVRKVTFTPSGEPEYGINPEVAEVLNSWWDEKMSLAMSSELVLDPIGYAIGEMRNQTRSEMRAEVSKLAKKLDLLLYNHEGQLEELRAKIEEQRVIIAELRGELRATRGTSKILRPGD